MNSGKKNVYYKTSGYASKRNFLSVPIKEYTFQKKYDLFKILDYIHYKLNGVNLFFRNSHYEFFPSNGIWHFFNGISFGKSPWVVTFETSLPRWGNSGQKLTEYGVQAMASKYCKGLIAMSECTKSFQIRYLEEEFPDYSKHIIPKIKVIHPPQKQLLDSYSEKKIPHDQRITFTLIGADFFRKGGKEILTVFNQYLQRDAPIKLNIISSLEYGDYASKATVEDYKYAKNIIGRYPTAINHFDKLTNEAVLKILKESHIGLLPTYGDTYGYSVLEAQACGCPVITTNIRALPEINNNHCGWIIKVPKNKWGNGVLETKKDRAEFSKVIISKLEKIIGEILSNNQIIKTKGKNSLIKIKEQHSPSDVALKLREIYDCITKSILSADER